MRVARVAKERPVKTKHKGRKNSLRKTTSEGGVTRERPMSILLQGRRNGLGEKKLVYTMHHKKENQYQKKKLVCIMHQARSSLRKTGLHSAPEMEEMSDKD